MIKYNKTRYKMMNQDTNMILDSLHKSKNASLTILSHSHTRKKQYFELMLNECENKVKRQIRDFCKITKSDKGNEYENKNGKYNFYTGDQKVLKTDHVDFGCAIVLSPGEKTLIICDNMFSCSKDNVVIELFGDICLTKYLYYYLLSNVDDIQHILNNNSLKETFDDPQIFNNFVVEIPSIEDQNKIIDEMEEEYKCYELTQKYVDKLDKLIEYKLNKHKNITTVCLLKFLVNL